MRVEPEEIAVGFAFVWLFIFGAVLGHTIYREFNK
jgi:hypothetical protein